MQNKKIIILVIAFGIVIIAGITVWQFGFYHKAVSEGCNKEVGLKTVTFVSTIDYVITFKIPNNWNVFYNGDPELFEDLNKPSSSRNIIGSVSGSTSPVTYTDANAEQVDFILTNKNLLTETFINAQNNATRQTFLPIKLDEFTGYVLDAFNKNEPASKANSNGLVYYLSPNITSLDWNLILSKQGKGSDEFENGVKTILQTLQYIKYEDYIKG